MNTEQPPQLPTNHQKPPLRPRGGCACSFFNSYFFSCCLLLSQVRQLILTAASERDIVPTSKSPLSRTSLPSLSWQCWTSPPAFARYLSLTCWIESVALFQNNVYDFLSVVTITTIAQSSEYFSLDHSFTQSHVSRLRLVSDYQLRYIVFDSRGQSLLDWLIVVIFDKTDSHLQG